MRGLSAVGWRGGSASPDISTARRRMLFYFMSSLTALNFHFRKLSEFTCLRELSATGKKGCDKAARDYAVPGRT